MWFDNLKDGSFTNADGKRVVFQYEEVTKDITKLGSRFDFRDVNNSYAQTAGVSSRSFPLSVYFYGENYDQQCDVFESVVLADVFPFFSKSGPWVCSSS